MSNTYMIQFDAIFYFKCNIFNPVTVFHLMLAKFLKTII